MYYQITKSLQAYEGFTVGVGFDKGFVEEPGVLEKVGASILMVLGAIGMFFYFLFTWRKYGVDPPKPTPYPIWDSPEDLSPASLGYIVKERYETKSVTSSVINLAVKGFLHINEEEKSGFFSKSKTYTLRRLRNDYEGLSKEEKELMDGLFGYEDQVVLDGEYDSEIKSAFDGHQASIAAQHEDFVREGYNLKFLILPILLTIGLAVLGGFLVNVNGGTINVISLVSFVVLAIIGIIIYGRLINKPTPEKLKLQSEIEGFKMYLQMAEEDRLNLLNPPEKTPEHFEAMLPFAYALGVEHIWSKIFKSILEKAMYRPEWSNNPHIYTSSHFSNNFGKTISSTTTPPSSSGGGSGGGGFSGGGGGGGGGGGW